MGYKVSHLLKYQSDSKKKKKEGKVQQVSKSDNKISKTQRKNLKKKLINESEPVKFSGDIAVGYSSVGSLEQQDQYSCHYCDNPFPRNELTLDHATPVTRGGSNTIANSVLACSNCNNEKGDTEYDEYKALKDKINKLK